MVTAIWNKPETATRAASVIGPPSINARTQNGMAMEMGIEVTMQPAPMGPNRTVCSTVVTPLTTSAAETIHSAWDALPPTACTTIIGNNTVGARSRMADCKPSPSATTSGGLSWGS